MNVNSIRERYPVGCKVQLDRMDDTQSPPIGTIGIVNHVDDMGTIHVNWETGSSLGLIVGEDEFHKIGG